MAQGDRLVTQVHPHTLIFSLYGQYVLPRGGEIWIGSLIQALKALDFNDAAVRALVSRMKRKGLLQSRRQGRYSFYRLTEAGMKEVTSGGQRTFGHSVQEWDGRWTVVTYSIPEEQRSCRDALRRALKWWGFGALAPGTWVSPRPLSAEIEKCCQDLTAWQYMEVFRAEHVGSSEWAELVEQAWPQLPALAACYRAFISEYASVCSCFDAGDLDEEACFATQLRSLCEFIAIMLADPALPGRLLPGDWPQPAAWGLFKQVQRTLAEPAGRFFDAVYRLDVEMGSPMPS